MGTPGSTSVELPEDLRAYVDEQLREGRYPSLSELLRDAVSVLRARDERIDGLRAALATGVAQLDTGDSREGSAAELAAELRSGRPFRRS